MIESKFFDWAKLRQGSLPYQKELADLDEKLLKFKAFNPEGKIIVAFKGSVEPDFEQLIKSRGALVQVIP